MALCVDDTVHLYFVEESTGGSREMRSAFTVCKDAELNPTILSKDDVVELTLTPSTVIVTEKFEGPWFDRLAQEDSLCRVVGPKVVSMCVEKVKPIPANESPVFNLAMEGVVATTSGLTGELKEETAKLIRWMGGLYCSQLTKAVTHVISSNVRSRKSESALDAALPLYRTSWVQAVWNASQTRNIHATDAEFDLFRAPPFEGMRITCSNFPAATKIKLQNLIEQNGGTYMKTLEHNQTTILVINVPEGAKYTHAQQWGIPCVKDSWVYECVQKRMPVHSDGHLLKAPPKCSTPTKELPSFMSSSEISVIPMASNTSEIDETCSTVSSTFSYKPNRLSPGRDVETVLKDINFIETLSAGLFLDGCKIYLLGFNAQEVDKLKKIAIKGGATIFTEINDRLSHVIVGRCDGSTNKEMREIERLPNKPDVVKLSWLVESIKLKATALVGLHLHVEKQPSEGQSNPPASPMSHKGLNLLTNNNFGSPTTSRPTNRKLFVKAPRENPTPVKIGTSKVAVMRSEPKVDQPPAPKKRFDETSTTTATDTSTSESTFVREPFFQGLVFQLLDISNSEACGNTISDLGGEVKSLSFQGVVDYAVVPINGPSKMLPATDVVTPLWVDDCYEKRQIVPVEYYHAPFPANLRKTEPLKGCVVTLSGYVDRERTFLKCCGDFLGARMQDAFAKKDNPDKGVYGSSHLICKTPTGSKFTAAQKWGVPALSEKWLLACLTTNSKAPVEPYRLNEEQNRTCASKLDEMTTMGVLAPTPSQPLSRPKIPPPAATQSPRPNSSLGAVDVENFATPVNYKRKLSSHGLLGKSPFHESTPETPYGRIFLEEGEEPSPSTRKRWKRFIDQFPDEGSPEFVEFRRRRPSTPLDVIKKQLCVKFGGVHIEGIEPGTGELLPDGPFAQWAGNDDSSSSANSSAVNANDGINNEARLKNKKTNDLQSQLSYFSNQLDNVLTPNSSDKSKSNTEDNYPPVKEQPNSKPDNDVGVKWIDRNNAVRRPSNPEEVWNFGQPLPANQNEPIASSDDTLSTPVLQEESEDREEAKGESDDSRERIFVLSSTTIQQKSMFEGIITSLGGVVSTESNYDSRSTHLLIEKLARSEKLLCTIASGKWVLHTSYITECYQARCFLPEEDFEWGNERAQSRLPRYARGTMEADLARAAHEWRIKSDQLGRIGAFTHIRAVVVATESRMAQYSRLLQAGRGVLLPKEKISDATHVFWDQGKIELPFEKSELKHVLLLKPVYLGDFLTKADPDVNKYTIRY